MKLPLENEPLWLYKNGAAAHDDISVLGFKCPDCEVHRVYPISWQQDNKGVFFNYYECNWCGEEFYTLGAGSVTFKKI